MRIASADASGPSGRGRPSPLAFRVRIGQNHAIPKRCRPIGDHAAMSPHRLVPAFLLALLTAACGSEAPAPEAAAGPVSLVERWPEVRFSATREHGLG